MWLQTIDAKGIVTSKALDGFNGLPNEFVDWWLRHENHC